MFREAELAKLPKWAQEKIVEMQRKLTDAEQVGETLGRSDSKTTLRLSHSIPAIGVPDFSILTVSDIGGSDQKITARRDDTGGNVSLYIVGTSQLEVLPSGGVNTIRVRMKLR